MPLVTPSETLGTKFLEFIWLKYWAETTSDPNLVIGHIPNPTLLISREAHYNLLRKYRADEVAWHEGNISLGNFLHIPSPMPRYNFICGSWTEVAPDDTKRFPSAQYEDALLWDKDPKNRWTLRYSRVTTLQAP